MKIFLLNPDTNKLYPVEQGIIHFYDDNGKLLLSEAVNEVLDTTIIQQLESVE